MSSPPILHPYGFDAQSGEFGNLVSKGIIDPTKVVRIALQDGSSASSPRFALPITFFTADGLGQRAQNGLGCSAFLRPLRFKHSKLSNFWPITFFDIDRNEFAGLVATPRANGDDLALRRLFLGGVGDDN
jgi:hypothetical protein